METMKSYTARTGEVLRAWYVVDAQDKVLGRLASRIAMVLRGKTKPTFTPHIDTGDFVVVVNAAQVQLTGRKLDNKFYYHHSGFPGGIKEISARKLLQKKPEDVLRHAVRGMLPKNSLGRQLLKKLKIYAGGEHPHEAQRPAPFPWED
ncbi:MAG TPA: 50S ribosomal protein L13 [Desulfobaccales bacterium]|nr:50S ribosomal protein L13 [Desulfobaccales bacterium]